MTSATKRLPAWFDGVPQEKSGGGVNFLTTHRFPLFYLQTTKCGSTYLRNLLYLLDNESVHDDGENIHAYDDVFVNAAHIERTTIMESPFTFTVVRNPVDRFTSLYFDKIVNSSGEEPTSVRNVLERRLGLDFDPDLDIQGHQDNAVSILRWLKMNLAGNTPAEVNPHWAPQANRLKRAKRFHPWVLTLDGLDWQLPLILSPLIPDIAEVLAKIPYRNASKPPFPAQELITARARKLIRRVYGEDMKIYNGIAQQWARIEAADR